MSRSHKQPYQAYHRDGMTSKRLSKKFLKKSVRKANAANLDKDMVENNGEGFIGKKFQDLTTGKTWKLPIKHFLTKESLIHQTKYYARTRNINEIDALKIVKHKIAGK